ncbi:MAG: tRNA pseudouridine(38-40) synthase TruA [Micrococcales bacterium]|nr:tRNA pseudouridine(38-40) synthase TruA [Micrococcales bacterium]
MRLRIDFAYDGTHFSGWAAQPGRRTVEADLTAALARILRADPPPRLTVAGRTDAGVHARGAVAHVDVDRGAWLALPGRSTRSPQVVGPVRLRGVLPPDIVVRSIAPAPQGFDARFSALLRRYSYTICDRPSALDPLDRFRVVVHPRELDVDAMSDAATALLGLHDFAAFCKRREGASTVRTLLGYSWRRCEHLVAATVVADAFCHSMVRSLIGAVVPVGEGRRARTWPREVLGRSRRESGVTVMPAHGLCLEEVRYAPPEELAARALATRAVRSLPE